MGLRDFKLAWHSMGNDGWLARLERWETDSGMLKTTLRYAHVNIYDWSIKPIKGKVLVTMQRGAPELSWHDSIEDAKLYVEALYALQD